MQVKAAASLLFSKDVPLKTSDHGWRNQIFKSRHYFSVLNRLILLCWYWKTCLVLSELRTSCNGQSCVCTLLNSFCKHFCGQECNTIHECVVGIKTEGCVQIITRVLFLYKVNIKRLSICRLLGTLDYLCHAGYVTASFCQQKTQSSLWKCW